jgi:hypothetical protein
MFNVLKMQKEDFWDIVETPPQEELRTVSQQHIDDAYNNIVLKSLAVCWNVANGSAIWIPNTEVKNVHDYVRIHNLFSNIKTNVNHDIIVYDDVFGILNNIFQNQQNICNINYSIKDQDEADNASFLNKKYDLNILKVEDVAKRNRPKTVISLDDDVTKMFEWDDVIEGYFFTKEKDMMVFSLLEYSVAMFGISNSMKYTYELEKIISDDSWSVLKFRRKNTEDILNGK